MARYFLDTGVVVGATFLHDAWYQETRRIIDSGNSFYVNRAVVYEYCNSTDENLLENTDVDWETNDGKFGEKLNTVRPAQTSLNLTLDTISENELTLDRLVDEFLLASHVYQKVDGELIVNEDDKNIDEDKVEEYIRPTLREFLHSIIGDQELTRPVAREAIDRLFDELIDGANKKRESLRDQVREVAVPTERREQHREDLGFIDGYIDTTILCDLKCLSNDNIVSRIVTTDKSDIYYNKGKLDEITVLYAKDKVADQSLPAEE